MRVAKDGSITWEGERIFLSTTLAHEDVELRYDEDETGDRSWDVVFGPLSVGARRGQFWARPAIPQRAHDRAVVSNSLARHGTERQPN
jgi:hypothetical protein